MSTHKLKTDKQAPFISHSPAPYSIPTPGFMNPHVFTRALETHRSHMSPLVFKLVSLIACFVLLFVVFSSLPSAARFGNLCLSSQIFRTQQIQQGTKEEEGGGGIGEITPSVCLRVCLRV